MSKQDKQIKVSIFSMAFLSLVSLIIGIIGIILFIIGFVNQSNQGIAWVGIMISLVTTVLAGADLLGCVIVIFEEKRKDIDVKDYMLYIMATLKDSVFSNIIFLIISSIILIILIIIYLIL